MPLPIFTRVVDDVDDVSAAHVNSLQAEIEKMAYGVQHNDYAALGSFSSNSVLTDADRPIIALSASSSGLSLSLPNPTSNSHAFFIMNYGSNAWTLKDNLGNVIIVVQPGAGIICWPTPGGKWAYALPHNGVVDDTLAPATNYKNWGEAIGMIANALKTMAGVSAWTSAAKPLNIMRYYMNGEGATVGAGTTSFIGPGSAIVTTGTNIRAPVDADQTFTSIRVRTTTAQPASGALAITLQIGGADTAAVVTVPVSGATGIYTWTGSVAISSSQVWNLKIANSATAASAGISGILVTAAV